MREPMTGCTSIFKNSSWLFTSADFEDALLDINSFLKTERSDDCRSISERKLLLEKAFSQAISCITLSQKPKPDKQVTFLLSETIMRYALLCHNDSFFVSKQLLLAALNLHLYSIGFIPDCIEIQDYTSLEALACRSKARARLFAFMEELILTTHTDACLSQAYTDSFCQQTPLKRLHNLAIIVRWLGHSYQNIESYCQPNQSNDRLFKQLFNLSESLLLLINTPESVKDLGDLYFRAWPFMHQRLYPQDIEGTCLLYNKALACDPSIEMELRVANTRFLHLFNERDEKAKNFLGMAIKLAEECKDNNSLGLLRANVHYNFAGYLMDPETIDLEEAEKHLHVAVAFANNRRNLGEDNLCFAIFDMRFAELKNALGDHAGAKKAIERAVATLKGYADSHEGLVIKADCLRNLISKNN